MYLTEEEKKMPIDMMLMQVVLGLQTCKTKGDVKDLLQEVYNIGLERGKYQPKKRWLKFIDSSKPDKKTKTIMVKNKANDEGLGFIKWDCGWRQYVFDDGTIKMAEGCQYEVFEKIKELREERENKDV